MNTKTLVQQLTEDEGNIPHAYQDSLGYWTIGVGRLIDKRKGGGLSPDEIQYLLANDIKNKTADCRKLFPDFDTYSQSRRDALVNLMFNLGYENLSSYKVFVGQVTRGEWEAVQDNLRGWARWHSQVGKRADRIIAALDIA